MMHRTNYTTRPLLSATLAKRMLLGAVPALILISLFLYGGGDGDPAWGKYWMIRPLIIVPVAGAMGGAFFHFLDHWTRGEGRLRILALVFGVIGYIVALWLGSVLGLDGTYWN